MPLSLLPEALAKGYTRFRSGAYLEESDRYQSLATEGQKPKTMIIACCDSRAAPETIFGAGPGELFVVRNVANLVPPYAPDGKQHGTSAALEFAVLALGVEHVVVMGHGRCGGIGAACAHDFSPLTSSDFIGKWVSDIRDVVAHAHIPEGCSADEKRTRVEHASVEHSLANLRTFPWLRARENEGKISIHGAWFDIALGELHVFNQKTNQWLSAEDAAKAA